ncbi:MAG: calcium-binding protein, partial [Methyloglobulus sp.]
MAIINGTNLNDNDTFQFNPFPFLQFFAKLDGTNLDDSISGFGGNDILNGFNGNDVLNGGADADTMNGGDGNDTYFVDNVGDVILNTTTFNPNLGEVNDFLGGVDTVNSFISYTLGASLENLNLTGFAAINGTGNIKNNVINGNSASNVLDGGAGADTMNAGDGSDTYFVDNTGDVVSESWNDALGGVDTVNSSVSFGPLGFGIENLNLTGFNAINGTGNSNNNVINGNSAANVIDGGTGADTMHGGDGSDTYFVDNTGDVVSEFWNDALGGVDTVNSSVNHTLGFGIENLNLTTTFSGLFLTGGIIGTGNENNNVINGNFFNNTLNGLDGNDVLNGGFGSDTLFGGNGNDTLDGGSGADTMNGGDGSDTYFVDDTGDVVSEFWNDALGGVDTVNSSASFGPLGFGIENLNLTGFAAINGTGNSNNNIINGNSAANVLNGGTGADTMNAGDGSDTYFVDNTGDVVSEFWNDALGGVDTVNSSVSFGPLGFGIE